MKKKEIGVSIELSIGFTRRGKLPLDSFLIEEKTKVAIEKNEEGNSPIREEGIIKKEWREREIGRKAKRVEKFKALIQTDTRKAKSSLKNDAKSK